MEEEQQVVRDSDSHRPQNRVLRGVHAEVVCGRRRLGLGWGGILDIFSTFQPALSACTRINAALPVCSSSSKQAKQVKIVKRPRRGDRSTLLVTCAGVRMSLHLPDWCPAGHFRGSEWSRARGVGWQDLPVRVSSAAVVQMGGGSGIGGVLHALIVPFGRTRIPKIYA